MTIQKRLAALKAEHGADWRAHAARRPEYIYNPRFQFPRGIGFPTWGHIRWIEDTDAAGLRFAGFADKLLNLKHTGWYSDNDQNETYRGAVYQLPARGGRAVFVYGYNDPNNNGAALLCFDHDAETAEDAARHADGMAERFAEEQREADAKANAELQREELTERLVTLRRDIALLISEAKAGCKTLDGARAIKRAIRAQLESMLAERRAAFERRATLAADPFSYLQ